MKPYEYHNKTALVTGASSGLGVEFAAQIAAKGGNVVLVARTKHKLEALAQELTNQYQIKATVIAADLSEDQAAQTIVKQLKQKGLKIDILVNNAGFGIYGRFEEIPIKDQRNEIIVNVLAVSELAQLLLPDMIKQKDGVIINVASTGAFQPVPYMAVYGASKAFVLSLSEALWVENQGSGVRILALCPGPTQTGFFDRAPGSKRSQKVADPKDVVAKALKSIDQSKSYLVPGGDNYFKAQAPRLLPRFVMAKIVGNLFKL